MKKLLFNVVILLSSISLYPMLRKFTTTNSAARFGAGVASASGSYSFTPSSNTVHLTSTPTSAVRHASGTFQKPFVVQSGADQDFYTDFAPVHQVSMPMAIGNRLEGFNQLIDHLGGDPVELTNSWTHEHYNPKYSYDLNRAIAYVSSRKLNPLTLTDNEWVKLKEKFRLGFLDLNKDKFMEYLLNEHINAQKAGYNGPYAQSAADVAKAYDEQRAELVKRHLDKMSLLDAKDRLQAQASGKAYERVLDY